MPVGSRGLLDSTPCRCLDERTNKRRRLLLQRRTFGLEQRRNKEGVTLHLHGADFALVASTDYPKWSLFEKPFVTRRQPVPAVVFLDHRRGAVCRSHPRTCCKRDCSHLLYECAR